jgi:uncharacterized spore protein YtfJ
MSALVPFQPIAELFDRSLSIRQVYGEPVHHGDVTVIPVAQVAFGFGGGGARRPSRRGARVSPVLADSAADAEDVPEGAGGGGGARLNPVGALEIGPHGTRFIRFRPLPQLLGLFVAGLAAGMLIARRSH